MKATMVNYYIQSPNRFRLEEIMREWCGERMISDGPADRMGRALISPEVQGWTVVYDEAVEQEPRLLNALGVRLSLELGTNVVAAAIYGEEVMMYTIYDDTGRIVDEFISDPLYLDDLLGDEVGEMDGTDGMDEVDEMDEVDMLPERDELDRMAWTRPDIHLLEELSTNGMAEAEMFAELLAPSDYRPPLPDELLEEFGALLGIGEDYIGLGYRDWIEFLGTPEGEELLHII